MIKKYLLGLGIIITGFISFSNAGTTQLITHESYNSSLNSNYKITFLKGGGFLTNYLGQGKSILALRDNVFVWWTDNGFPYFYLQSSNTPYFGLEQGFPDRYYLCDEITEGQKNAPGNCNESQIRDYSGDNGLIKKDLQTFFKKVNLNDLVYYEFIDHNRELYMYLCWNSSDLGNSLCFKVGKDNHYISGNVVYYKSSPLINSQNYTDLTFGGINIGWIGYAPGQNLYNVNVSSGYLDNGGISLNSDASAINYFEKTYNWDSSICYAGVDNLSYLYGQNGVSFNKGSGLSIFDVFEQLYGNRDLDKVYVWLNVQLFNYENWFNIPGNNIGGVGYPSWLGNYNSGTNQIDLYYDNLTFPFANKPVAFYFLADNIEDQSPYFTMGSEVVSYCNLKINNGTFDEIIDDAVKNNINNYTQQFNTNQALNPDGSSKDYTGYWVGSGVSLAFSGNVSIKNTLKNFFDEFDKGLSVVDINTNNRILPTWIVSAFIFVVLFKFLRKR